MANHKNSVAAAKRRAVTPPPPGTLTIASDLPAKSGDQTRCAFDEILAHQNPASQSLG